MAMGRLSNRLKAAGTGSRLAVDLAPRHAFYDESIRNRGALGSLGRQRQVG
jgi:hypothetical protein